MQKFFNVIGALSFLALIIVAIVMALTPPPKAEPVRTGLIAADEYEPARWGQHYPLEYEYWLKTKEPKPSGKSKYKKGWDDDGVIYDKLSEFPYMPLLFNGWGFGIEYNEPRGHFYMMVDQHEVDQSRTKAGGACLTCKSPYAGKLVADTKGAIFSTPYADAVNMIPEKHRYLGVACIDCHDNSTMDLRLSKWTVKAALGAVGHPAPSKQELRSAVCAQCHVTYVIPKDAEMRSTDVVFPWKGSKWGDISIENIIKFIKSSPSHLEWKQAVTGFKLGFIRHPEFELFSRQSVHWNAKVACADCHMPYKRVGSSKISDHNVTSPLKDDMRACIQCHAESAEWLRERVINTQDRTAAMMNRAGYATAVTAKLFEIANREAAGGKSVEAEIYSKAKDFYEEAFYRAVFLGAENSLGFHNPTEAMRIAGDSVAFAGKAEALLRQGMAKAGIDVPARVNLELSKYLNDRGSKKLKFRREQELPDPTGIQDILLPPESRGIK